MSLGTQTQSYGKLLDYEQFIDHQLARTRTRIKATDIVTAALILLVGIAGTLLAEVILDHAFGLPLIVRRVILVVGMTAAFAFTLLRVVLPLVLRINSVYAAKTIESVNTTFKNSLVNYLTLRAHRDRLPRAVLATLEARAVSDLAHVEVDQAVNQQHLMKAFYTLCGVAVVFFLYAAFQPKSILDSTRRAFLADVVRPTNTRLLDIKPGDAEVVAGKQVIFSVDTNRGVRPAVVKLHYSVDGGKFYAIKEFEPGTNYYDPWQLTFNNVQQTMDYYVTGGDGESLHYTLTVLPAPMVTSVKIDYDFPKYTQVPPRKDIEGGNVEAIEDTTVTVHATTNEPSRGGTLNLTAGDPAPMSVAADDSRKLTGQFKVTKSGTYTINFRTTGGQLNPNPVVYDIHAIADRPPQAKFLQPDRPTIKVPANVKVDLIMTGSDDHGVKDATLHVNLENESLYSKNVLEGRPTAPEFRATEVIDLAQLRVKSGQTLRYWLTVRDNHEPASHSVQTASQLIEITEAVAPADKQKLEEKQAKEREQFEKAPPPETEPPQDQVPPPDQQTGEDKTGTEKDQGQQGKSDAEKGGAGNDRQPDQGRGTQDKSGGPDQGAASSETAGQPGQNNPAGGQQPPAVDPQLRKLTEGLQKKGLLNPNAGQGNPQPPQSNDAANPQQANPGNGSQQPQNGTPNQNGNAGRQNTPQQNAMQNPSSPAGNPAGTPPQPQGSQGADNSGNQVQPGQKGSDQPRGDAGNPAGGNPPQPGTGTQSQGSQGQNSPGNQTPSSGTDSQGENKTNGSDAQNGKAADNQRSPGETQSKTNQETPGSKTQGDPQASDNSSNSQKGNNPPRDAADRQGGSTKDQNSAMQDKEQGGSKQGNTQGTAGSNEPGQTGSDKPTGGQEKSGSEKGNQDSGDHQPAGKNSSEPGTASEGNGGEKTPGQPNAKNETNGKASPGNGSKTGQPTGKADQSQDSPNAQAGEAGSAQKPNGKSDGSASNSSQKDASGQPKAGGDSPNQPGQPMARDAAGNPAQEGSQPKNGESNPRGKPKPDSNPASQRSGEKSTGSPASSEMNEQLPPGDPRNVINDPRITQDERNRSHDPSAPRAQDPQNAAGRQDQTSGNPQQQSKDQAGTSAENPAQGKDQTQQGKADRQTTKPDGAASKDATSSQDMDATKKTDEEKKTDKGYTSPPQPKEPDPKKTQKPTEPEATNPPEPAPEPARELERPRQTPIMPPGQTDHSPSASQGQQGSQGDENPATTARSGQNGNMPAKQGTQDQVKSQNTDGQPHQGEGKGEGGHQAHEGGQGDHESSGTHSGSHGSSGSKSQGAGEQSSTGSNSKSGGHPAGENGNHSGAGTSGEHGSSPANDGQKPGEGTGPVKNGEGSQGHGGSPHEGNEAGGKSGASSPHGASSGQQSHEGGHEGGQGNHSGAAGGSQPSGGQPTGEPGQGNQQGGPSRSPIGGGGRPGANSNGGNAKDDSKPSPRAAEPENPSSGDDVAPQGQSQTDMVLRTVKDLLAKDAVTPDLEKETGMTREQMEQFVKKYEHVKSAPAGPGREITVNPGDRERTDQPSANLPGFGRQERYSTKSQKDRGQMVRDDVQNNLEGISFKAPPEFRSKFEGYRTSLARTRSGASKKPAPARPAPAGGK